MSPKPNKPLVAIPCDTKMVGKQIHHVAGEKYIDAVRDHAGVTPLLVPATATPLSAEEILSWADGLLFTGALSNVYPPHYGVDDWRSDMLLDQQRDDTTLPLIRTAIEAGIPTLFICRGIQELNVALGGTLHQRLHEIEGRFDHREPNSESLDVMYDKVHAVDLTPGGMLQQILNGQSSVQVNSLHHQGIDRLADGLKVEAIAQDGTIEAVSLPSAKSYLLGVQWHPEWKPEETPDCRAILGSFGDAVRGAVKAERVPNKL